MWFSICKQKWNFWLIEEIFVFGCKESRGVQDEWAAARLTAVLREDPPPPSRSSVPHCFSLHLRVQWCAGYDNSSNACVIPYWVCLCSDNHQHFGHGCFLGGTTAWGSVTSTLLEWLSMPKQFNEYTRRGLEALPLMRSCPFTGWE